MATKLVKGVMTNEGIAQIDYESLANLPTIDSVPTHGSTNAVQSGAVYIALEGKLDASDGKAADSILFGGQAPEYYATAEDVQTLTDKVDNDLAQAIETITVDLNKKLDAEAQAVDSAKLGGQDPSYYATKIEVDDAQLTADNALSTANQAMLNFAGCWIEFTDEEGNPTDEPYVHWIVEE